MKQVLFIILGVLWTLNIEAQMTIGSDEPPASGALLQLKETSGITDNSEKGLSLPRIELVSLTGDLAASMGAESGTYDAQSHIGLLVYNVGINDSISEASRVCPGMHVWTGDRWEALTSYPPIAREETLDSFLSGEFFYLDPADPNDSGWKFIGKNATDYGPLGHMFSVTDTDGNAYTATRFYVGFFRRWSTYKVRESYSCNSNNPKWINLPDTTKFKDTFEDGIWMSQNLKVKNYEPLRDNPLDTSIVSLSQASTIITDPTLARWEYPNKASVNESTMGLLYTWAAATNGKAWTRYDIGILEGDRVQGICPKGWHLPSDRQWTDLENALILNSSIFTDPEVANSSSKLSYTEEYGRGSHSPILRNRASGSGTDQGKSKTAINGGFDAYDMGFLDNGLATLFGVGSGWWTSSHPTSLQGQRRAVFNQSQDSWMNSANVYRDAVDRQLMLGIRCLKNTD